MTELKSPLRMGILAGASVLVLGLAAPAMANELHNSTGSTVDVPQAPDLETTYRPDPNAKTLGELEREMAQANAPQQSGQTMEQRAGDMNKLGETSAGQPVRQGTAVPAGSAQPMGDATSPGSGNYGASASTGMPHQGMTTSGAANLEVERVRVQELSPSLQAAIRDRMGPRQTPNELVETTILNRLALMGSEYTLSSSRKVGTDYVLVISTPDGKESTMVYEASSGNLREVQM